MSEKKIKFPTPESPEALFREKHKNLGRGQKNYGDEIGEVKLEHEATAKDLQEAIEARYPGVADKESEKGRHTRGILAKEIVSERKENKEVAVIKVKLEKIRQERADLLKSRQVLLRQTFGKSDAHSMRRVSAISTMIEELATEEGDLMTKTEYALPAREADLLIVREELAAHGYTFTPALRKEYEWLTEASAAMRPLLLSGPTGTGKTELVRAFCREVIGEQPVEIRGHENTRMEEFVGSTGLRASNNTRPEDLLIKWNEAGRLAEEKIKHSPQDYETKEQRENAFRDALDLVGRTIGVTTETYREMGAIGRALEQSRRCGMSVLLIDELSRIPEDVVGGGLKGFFHELRKAGVLVVATANQKDAKHKAVRELAPQEKREYTERRIPYLPKGDLYDLATADLMSASGEVRASKEELTQVLGHFISAIVEVQKGYTGKFTNAYGQTDNALKPTSLNSTVIEQGKLLGWLTGFNESGKSLYDFLTARVSEYIENLHDGTNETAEDKKVIGNIFASFGFAVPNALNIANFPLEERFESASQLISVKKVALCDPYSLRPHVRERRSEDGTPPLTPEDIEALGLRTPPTPETPENLREIIERDYGLQMRVHRAAGLLERLTNGTDGHKAINGQEYGFPTMGQVLERLERKRGLIELKLKQYNNPKIIITPIGKRTLDIAESWKEQIVKYKEKLHNRDGSKVEAKDNYDTTKYALEKQNAPVWIWEKYKNDTEAVYDPVVFNADPAIHKGKSKTQILEQIGGYSIILMEDQEAPRENLAVAKNGRKPLEANRNANQYLESILNDPQYKGEVGQYHEEEIMYAITKLIEEDGLVVDNYSKETSSSVYCPGSYLAGSCPVVCWDAGVRRAVLGGFVPGFRNAYRAARASVRA